MSNIESDKQAEYLDHVLTIKQFFKRHRHGSYIFAVSYSYALKKEVNREVIEFCKENGLSVGEAEIQFETNTTPIQQLKDAKNKFPDGLILTNVDEVMLVSHDEFAYQLNQMREALFELHIPVLIWLTPENHRAFTHKAIDLYTRRDLDTIFFPEIKPEDTSHLLERSEMRLEQTEDPETLRTRIFLLEKQLEAARKDDIPRSRIAKEIVLPLINAYKQLLMIQPALSLVGEFKNDFGGNERDAFIVFGQLNRQAGNLENAIHYFESALEIDMNAIGDESHKTAVDHNELGLAFKDKGDLNEAIRHYEKSLTIVLKLFGEQHSYVAVRYNNLGMAWNEKGDFEKAINYLENALAIDLKLFGEQNPRVAVRYSNIGLAWNKKGDLDKAINYSEKALAIDLKSFGEQNHNVAVRYNNLGFAMKRKGDLDKAINYYEKALAIHLKLFGEQNPEAAALYNNLGSVWQDKDNLDKAKLYYRKAFDIISKTYGRQHHYALDLTNKIASVETSKQINPKTTASNQAALPAEATSTVQVSDTTGAE